MKLLAWIFLFSPSIRSMAMACIWQRSLSVFSSYQCRIVLEMRARAFHQFFFVGHRLNPAHGLRFNPVFQLFVQCSRVQMRGLGHYRRRSYFGDSPFLSMRAIRCIGIFWISIVSMLPGILLATMSSLLY